MTERILTYESLTTPGQQILNAALIGMHLVDRALVAPIGGPIAELDRTLELVRTTEEDGLVDETEEIDAQIAEELARIPNCQACLEPITDDVICYRDARYCSCCLPNPRSDLLDD